MHVVRAILLGEEGKVLIGKRAHGMEVGKWALIGGKPDEGEDLYDAIQREVKEELGLFFNPSSWYEIPDHLFDPSRVWSIWVFIGRVMGAIRLAPQEISEIGWVNKNTLDQFDLAFNHRHILEKFFES